MSLIEISLVASLQIASILAIRALALYKLPKVLFVYLWWTVLARLFLPGQISFAWFGGKLPANIDFSAVAAKGNVARAWNMEHFANALPILIAIWLVVAAIVFLLFTGLHIVARREYRCSLPVAHSAVVDWLAQHPLRRKLCVRQSDRIDSPITYGVFCPVILLPSSANWDDSEKLNCMLLHEWMHCKHFDVLVKWLLVIAVSLYWFNPLVWVMFLFANRDMELYCDECVVLQLGLKARASYAHTLVSLENRRQNFMPIVGTFEGHSLKERVEAIMKSKKKTSVTALLIVALVAILLMVGFTMGGNSSNITASSSSDHSSNTDIVMDLPEYVDDSTPDHKAESRDYVVGFTPSR